MQAQAEVAVIVLDHADGGVWEELHDVHVVEEWRRKTLVSYEWILAGGDVNLIS